MKYVHWLSYEGLLNVSTVFKINARHSYQKLDQSFQLLIFISENNEKNSVIKFGASKCRSKVTVFLKVYIFL